MEGGEDSNPISIDEIAGDILGEATGGMSDIVDKVVSGRTKADLFEDKMQAIKTPDKVQPLLASQKIEQPQTTRRSNRVNVKRKKAGERVFDYLLKHKGQQFYSSDLAGNIGIAEGTLEQQKNKIKSLVNDYNDKNQNRRIQFIYSRGGLYRIGVEGITYNSYPSSINKKKKKQPKQKQRIIPYDEVLRRIYSR